MQMGEEKWMQFSLAVGFIKQLLLGTSSSQKRIPLKIQLMAGKVKLQNQLQPKAIKLQKLFKIRCLIPERIIWRTQLD